MALYHTLTKEPKEELTTEEIEEFQTNARAWVQKYLGVFQAKNVTPYNLKHKSPEQCSMKQILAEIEPLYQHAYGHSFTESLTQCPGSNIREKPSPYEKKKLKRKIQRDCRDCMTEQYHQSDPLLVLAEGIPLASYNECDSDILMNLHDRKTNVPKIPHQFHENTTQTSKQ